MFGCRSNDPGSMSDWLFCSTTMVPTVVGVLCITSPLVLCIRDSCTNKFRTNFKMEGKCHRVKIKLIINSYCLAVEANNVV